jgi:hypothetical protein
MMRNKSMKEKLVLGQPKENWIYLFIILGGGLIATLIGYFQNGGGL